MTIHVFGESLARSRSRESASFWLATYRKAFPTLLTAEPIRDDGWAQRAGIDRVLTLACGRTIWIDEKVREKDYGDILLERWSNYERLVDGWIVKPVACHYLAYAIVPRSVCYLFPMLELQRAWRLQREVWGRLANRREPGYRFYRAPNVGYTTMNIAVPTIVLFDAIKDAMVVNWQEAPCNLALP